MMFVNYLKVALRNLLRNPGYSLINVGGLAVGLACCFLIAVYVSHEYSYDRFHEKGEAIYRLIPVGSQGGVEVPQTWTPSAFAGDLLELPDVEQAVRLSFFGTGNLLTHQRRTIGDGHGVVLADSSFFQVFSFPLLQGDPAEVLDQPFEAVISRSIANTYFQGRSPLGETIRYDGRHDFTITGVMDNMPENSHIQADLVASFLTLQPIAEASRQLPEGYNLLDQYGSWNYSTYIAVSGRPRVAELTAKVAGHLEERMGREPGGLNLRLQPLHDIHFDKGIRGDLGGGDRNAVYAFSAVAMFILVIAGFNFVNLTTARSVRRAREVGVRKALGAHRLQLAGQFVAESMLVGLLSVALALLLLELALPWFASVVGSDMALDWSANGAMAAGLVVLGVTAALGAAAYPAFYLASFHPVGALKNSFGGQSRNAMRQVLTGLQFGIAALLIIGSLTVHRQMTFVSSRDLGFEREQVVYLQPPQEIAQDDYWTFREQLLQHPFVERVSRSNKLPGMINSHRTFTVEGPDGPVGGGFNNYTADPDFVPLLDLEMAAGRNLSWERESDLQNGFLINEAAARHLGLDNPVGTPMKVSQSEQYGRIVGVVRDFHYNSLHKTIEPLVIWYAPGESWTVSVRMQTENLEKNLAAMGETWSKFAPAHPFSYTFLDQSFEQQYRDDRNFSRLLSGFTLVGMVIACLGLLGLSSYAVEQRRREIGIRKVLGASVQSIAALFSLDFLKLVAVAFLAVIPIAWLAADGWLQNFAYRSAQSLYVYGLAGMVLGGLALLTISWQAVRAALTNPVNVLKDE